MKLENKMYQGAPWCLGRYDGFKVDQPKLITLLGHDYVIWRDKSGNINAIDNICPHAGASFGIVTIYPESEQRIRICLDSYIDLDFAWWQKLIRLPQLANAFRDRLIMEDISIMENLYQTFNHKITLKNDTSATLAINYLQSWHD